MRLHVARLDDAGGGLAVLLKQRGEYIRTVQHRLQAALNEVAVHECRLARDARHLVANFSDHGFRGSGRRNEAEEAGRVVAPITDLVQSGKLRKQRRPLFAVDHQPFDLSAAQILDHVSQPEERDRCRSGQQAVDRVAAAFERHPDQVRARAPFVVLHEQRQRQARHGVAQRARSCLRQGGKLVEAVHAQRRVDHKDLRQQEQGGDRLEIALRIERQRLVQMLAIDQRLTRKHADRVAVWRRLGAGTGADIHAAAGAVLDDERLPPPLVQLFAQDPHEQVADPAGADRDDGPDRLGRIVLRRRCGRRCQCKRRAHERR